MGNITGNLYNPQEILYSPKVKRVWWQAGGEILKEINISHRNITLSKCEIGLVLGCWENDSSFKIDTW